MPGLTLKAHRGKKSKKSDGRQARQRYWNDGHLIKTKIRALMKNAGLTRAKAEKFWAAVRGNRRMPGKSEKTILSPQEQSVLYRQIRG